jgi:hypothetical protein
MSELNTNELKSTENKITYSTCFYQFKNKHTKETFFEWIDNMLSQVNHYYLVVYTDKDTEPLFKKYTSNKNILLVVKTIEEFKTYKYKEKWISNHKINNNLKDQVSWEVNMLWNEKIHFVCETKTKKYFDTPFYGWCDIGYFRNTPNDMNKNELVNWSHPKKIDTLHHNKIYYALINNDMKYIHSLVNCIQNKNALGLPVIPIPSHQVSIAGGFFISHKDKIEMWRDYYYSKLELYFDNNYLVKDDQIIVADCIFSRIEGFNLILENNPKYDNWFLFQRYLSLTNEVDKI